MKKLLIPVLALVLTGCTAVVDDKYYIPEFTRGHDDVYLASQLALC